MCPCCAGVPACSHLCAARPELGTPSTWGIGAELGVPVAGGHMAHPAPGTLVPVSGGDGSGCPVPPLCPAAPLCSRAQLAVTPCCAQLPTSSWGVRSPPKLSARCPGPHSSCHSLRRGACATSPCSGSCSSAWILLPVRPRRGKAGFYGRRPTAFLPSCGARHRVPPRRLCWGQWVLQVAAQPVVMGDVEKNS